VGGKGGTEFPFSLIDLTHTVEKTSPTWDGRCGFESFLNADYEAGLHVSFRVQSFHMNAGIGTHLDAPAHCIEGGWTVEQIPLSHLVTRCVVIDVGEKAQENYQVSGQDVAKFEKEYGIIPKDTFVMVKTGWERFWEEPEKYRNNHRFPTLSADAAQMLVGRDIAGIGIDTLSPDRAEEGFPVHKAMLGAGKYIVENAANLNSLSPIGNFVMVLPLKTKEATEAPVRLVGLLPREGNL
jgi:kynurenine formamidase